MSLSERPLAEGLLHELSRREPSRGRPETRGAAQFGDCFIGPGNEPRSTSTEAVVRLGTDARPSP